MTRSARPRRPGGTAHAGRDALVVQARLHVRRDRGHPLPEGAAVVCANLVGVDVAGARLDCSQQARLPFVVAMAASIGDVVVIGPPARARPGGATAPVPYDTRSSAGLAASDGIIAFVPCAPGRRIAVYEGLRRRQHPERRHRRPFAAPARPSSPPPSCSTPGWSTASAGSTTARRSPTSTKRRSRASTRSAASLAYAEWNKHKINLIDTPGFGNFLSDTRAALRVVGRRRRRRRRGVGRRGADREGVGGGRGVRRCRAWSSSTGSTASAPASSRTLESLHDGVRPHRHPGADADRRGEVVPRRRRPRRR